ncbi:MAG: DUF1295 domain-containing protein, partial [Actinomycetota bacterium]
MQGKFLLQSALVVAIGFAVGLAGSDGGETLGGIGLFLAFVILAYVVQWLVYVPSYLNQTEHFFDLTGSITYQLIALLALILTEDRDARTVIVAVMIWIWAFRLGTFLFRRVRAAGKDDRFDKLKTDWARFLLVWTIQGLWITFTAAAGLAAITSGDKQDLGVVGIIGIVVWLL